jgi:hypothetical protein
LEAWLNSVSDARGIIGLAGVVFSYGSWMLEVCPERGRRIGCWISRLVI